MAYFPSLFQASSIEYLYRYNQRNNLNLLDEVKAIYANKITNKQTSDSFLSSTL